MTVYTVLSIGMFTLGDAFVYFVMMPVSLNFLLTFGADIAVPLILLDEYMGLLFSLFMWIGLIFLLPIIMNLLARFGVLSYKRARSVHRVGIPTIIFFSAMISPGLDGLLTALVAASMYSLYLVGLGAVWITNPQEGNYLFYWTLRRWLRNLRDAVIWFLMRPVVAVRKVHYKFRDNNRVDR
jgi:sec-independent protein translocase protein TatC